jgi:hypothetical protein
MGTIVLASVNDFVRKYRTINVIIVFMDTKTKILLTLNGIRVWDILKPSAAKSINKDEV